MAQMTNMAHRQDMAMRIACLAPNDGRVRRASRANRANCTNCTNDTNCTNHKASPR